MAIRFLKPAAGNVDGLSSAQTLIGTDCKNARIAITDVHMDDDGWINFITSYFWNAAAWQTYQDETAGLKATPPTVISRSVIPFRQVGYRIQGDPDGASPKNQATTYLLTQFPGFEQG